MAIMDIQVSPRKLGTVSVSAGVTEAHQVIRASGLKHLLHPMGTCIEGEPAQLYELASAIHKRLGQLGYQRIGVYIKIDERLDKPQTMEDKVSRINGLLRK